MRLDSTQFNSNQNNLQILVKFNVIISENTSQRDSTRVDSTRLNPIQTKTIYKYTNKLNQAKAKTINQTTSRRYVNSKSPKSTTINQTL
jgi:hypothetical protein